MHKMKYILISLVLVAVSFAILHAANASQVYHLYFPDINLNKSDTERIEEINIKVACGHINAIHNIPDDWNIEIIRAISDVEEFHASAGHGASRLNDISTLSGIISITVGEKACFDVSASIMTIGTKTGRKIELPLSKLRLLP